MKTLKLNSDKLWFTSDTHLHHANIIGFCNRPFNNIAHMDRTIIDNWNSVVQPDDIVVHGGDFCWGDTKMWLYFLDQLQGIKILVRGNHDKDGTYPKTKFQMIYEILNILVADPETKEGQRITVCHYPMLSWYQSHRGAWQLFGHWHNSKIKAPDEKGNNLLSANVEVVDYVKEEHIYMERTRPTQYDIGVDGNNFTPISYNQVKKIILNKIDSQRGV